MSDRKPKRDSLRILALSFIAIAFAVSGCGKSEDQELRDAGGVPVTGVAAFGSQCPYGSIAQPIPTKLQLWNCPIGLDRLELTDPLEPLFIMGDCKRKVITVRMGERRMDTAWNVMPDGSFFFSVDGGVASLKADGPNRGSCVTPLSADMMGKWIAPILTKRSSASKPSGGWARAAILIAP